jgi:hypothetical protein
MVENLYKSSSIYHVSMIHLMKHGSLKPRKKKGSMGMSKHRKCGYAPNNPTILMLFARAYNSERQRYAEMKVRRTQWFSSIEQLFSV